MGLRAREEEEEQAGGQRQWLREGHGAVGARERDGGGGKSGLL